MGLICCETPSLSRRALLATGGSPVEVALSLYPTPAVVIEAALNVATPFTAATVAVPEMAPLAGFVEMMSVTFGDALVTVLPLASCTATRTAGVKGSLIARLLGCVRNASLAGTETTLKVLLVATPSAPESATSVYPLPMADTCNPGNCATPLIAFAVTVPLKAPPPGFEPMASVTGPLADVTRLPKESSTWTRTLCAAGCPNT